MLVMVFILINQYNVVFFVFVDSVVWVGCYVIGIEVVFVQVWQVYYEGVFKLFVYFFLYGFEVVVVGMFFKFVVQQFFLVWVLDYFVYLFVVNQ